MTYSVGCLYVLVVQLSVVCIELSVAFVVLYVVVVLSFIVVYPVTFLQVCLHYLQLEKQLMWSFCLNSHLHTSGLQEKFPQMPSC